MESLWNIYNITKLRFHSPVVVFVLVFITHQFAQLDQKSGLQQRKTKQKNKCIKINLYLMAGDRQLSRLGPFVFLPSRWQDTAVPNKTTASDNNTARESGQPSVGGILSAIQLLLSFAGEIPQLQSRLSISTVVLIEFQISERRKKSWNPLRLSTGVVLLNTSTTTTTHTHTQKKPNDMFFSSRLRK